MTFKRLKERVELSYTARFGKHLKKKQKLLSVKCLGELLENHEKWNRKKQVSKCCAIWLFTALIPDWWEGDPFTMPMKTCSHGKRTGNFLVGDESIFSLL